ncbi:hypothetical protein ONZ45_g13494 [Pleurotus djamor]|nr:hypothetical protein ONZ45_g13494 [Pleurotus djamor]
MVAVDNNEKLKEGSKRADRSRLPSYSVLTHSSTLSASPTASNTPPLIPVCLHLDSTLAGSCPSSLTNGLEYTIWLTHPHLPTPQLLLEHPVPVHLEDRDFVPSHARNFIVVIEGESGNARSFQIRKTNRFTAKEEILAPWLRRDGGVDVLERLPHSTSRHRVCESPEPEGMVLRAHSTSRSLPAPKWSMDVTGTSPAAPETSMSTRLRKPFRYTLKAPQPYFLLTTEETSISRSTSIDGRTIAMDPSSSTIGAPLTKFIKARGYLNPQYLRETLEEQPTSDGATLIFVIKHSHYNQLVSLTLAKNHKPRISQSASNPRSTIVVHPRSYVIRDPLTGFTKGCVVFSNFEPCTRRTVPLTPKCQTRENGRHIIME